MKTRAKLEKLKGNGRTSEARVWNDWLEKAAALTARFDGELGDDPFAYNETASVSLLAAAAAQAGLLGLAEFCVTKGHVLDRRVSAAGRCDFWLDGPSCTWAFEFKQLIPASVTAKMLQRAQANAVSCARCVRASEADGRVAGLIVSLFFLEADLDEARARLEAFAQDRDFAWRITEGEESADTYFFFDLI